MFWYLRNPVRFSLCTWKHSVQGSVGFSTRPHRSGPSNTEGLSPFLRPQRPAVPSSHRNSGRAAGETCPRLHGTSVISCTGCGMRFQARMAMPRQREGSETCSAPGRDASLVLWSWTWFSLGSSQGYTLNSDAFRGDGLRLVLGV